jgi:histidinol dehydrogenase
MKINRFHLPSSDAATVRAIVSRTRAAQSKDVKAAVGEIIRAVRSGGDSTLVDYVRRFDTNVTEDQPGVSPDPLHVTPTDDDWYEGAAKQLAALPPDVRAALEMARTNIRAVADGWAAEDPTTARDITFDAGHSVRLVETPVRRAALCIPGGQAPFVSTVLMTVEAARAAGVSELVVCTPPGLDGRLHPALQAVLALVGRVEVVCAGGAHAVAAVAYGTERIARVDVIAGPGGVYVQEAKRQAFGDVGIDGIAGPSELVLVVDGDQELDRLALDLVAQAEHLEQTTVVAVSPESAILDALEALLAGAGDESFAACTLLQVQDLGAAEAFVEAFAPEHVQLAGPGAEQLADHLTTAGCVFVGAWSGTAFGDYIAGSNHVLPTNNAARFASVLNPAHFRRRSSIVRLTEPSSHELARPGAAIARLEGLEAHAQSLLARGPSGA